MNKAMRLFLFMAIIAAATIGSTVGHLEARIIRDAKAPGKLVDLGGYRLHINCEGKTTNGKPLVILIHGGGDFSFDWALVMPGVSRFAHVCAYDQAGQAWSDPGPTPRTLRQEAYELHLLLEKTGLKGPYVLVGHSLGGLIARVFARDFPKDIAGMVLVEATSEDTTLMLNGKLVHMREIARNVAVPPVQTMKTSPPKPASEQEIKEAEAFQKQFGPPKIDPPFDKLPADIQQLRLWALTHQKLMAQSEGYLAEELKEMHTATHSADYVLGDLPLEVLIGGRMEGRPPNVAQEEWKRLFDEKVQQKKEFGRLSRNSKVVVDPVSAHHIPLDNPDLVITAIREVVEVASHHAKL
jgi:pimeloyl-ACP methyl ester carboxylesterase